MRELREERELSQAQLARETGIHKRMISHYEIGDREPDIETIKKLCEFFNCTAGYLLGIEEV